MSGRQRPLCQWLNPYGIEHLNGLLADPDYELFLSEPISWKPKKKIHPRVPRRDGDVRKFFIHHVCKDLPGTIRMFYRSIGFVFIDRGFLDPHSNYSGSYEAMKMRIKKPILLKDGRTLPAVTYKRYVERKAFEKEDDDGGDCHVRTYRWKIFPTWKKTALSDVLVPEWFRGGNTGSIRARQRIGEEEDLYKEVEKELETESL